MKIKRYFINIFLFLTVITFYSCSNITEEKLTETNLATVFIDFDSFARTVTPTVNLDNLTNIVVTGKQEGENAYKEIIRFSNCENFNSFEVETGIWTFKLSANCGNSRLDAELTKEIIIGNNILHFDLELSDYGNSTGALNVKLNFPDSANVKVIKAGLYTVDTNQEVSGFGQEVLSVSNASVSYKKDNAPSGSYILKFNFYADENAEVLINTYKELVKIASDCTSTAERTVTDLNEIYNINYVLDGGTFADGISVPVCATRFSEPFTLPDVFQIRKEKFYLDGFYNNPEFEGEKITQIENVREDLTLYAKWVRGYYITASSADCLDLSDGNQEYNIVVCGELNDDSFKLIMQEINRISYKYKNNSIVNLDLSQTTGKKRLPVQDYYPDQYVSLIDENTPLKTIILPASLELIYDGEFISNKFLEKIEFLGESTKIGAASFKWCSSLKSIILPKSLTIINDATFMGCSSLTSVEIPDSVTNLGNLAFETCESLVSIEIPDSVTSIGKNAFAYCTSLISVDIPESVMNIGEYAFAGCRSLQNIKIPAYVTRIDDYAFYLCESLTDIIIPKSVLSIGDSAFQDCRSLSNLEIPKSVTKIGDLAFHGCTNLKMVYFEDPNNWYMSYHSDYSDGDKIDFTNSTTNVGKLVYAHYLYKE